MKRFISTVCLIILLVLLCVKTDREIFSQTKEIIPSTESKEKFNTKQFDWQRTDQYIPPNFENYFPDDEEGGKKLDALWNANDKDSRPDEEILSTVRNGLRRGSTHKLFTLRWIGNKYIWGKQSQNPEAIEIMYHATDGDKNDTRGPAIYFGLSVVQTKTPNILRALVEICMNDDDPNDLDRIAWGTQNQREEILPYLKPYLDNTDDMVNEKAQVVEKILKGELKAFKWAEDRAREKAKVEYTTKLPEIKEKLLSGDSQARKDVIKLVMQNAITLIMDDSFIEAWKACAKDKDSGVRAEVARTFGEHWVWSSREQKPEAIDLMIELSKDENREVRYNAVYFGLSTVREKNEAAVKRLLEIAMDDKDPNNYQRITWGIKRNRDLAKKVLEDYISQYETNPELAYKAFQIYEDMTGEKAANPERFVKIKEKISADINDVYIIVFTGKESFQPKDGEELYKEFESKLPEDIKTQDFRWKKWNNAIVGYVYIDGTFEKDKVKKMIEESPNLQLLETEFAPEEMQKMLKESQEFKSIEENK